MYALLDATNDTRISNHRTLEGVARSQEKHIRAVVRANGKGYWISYKVTHVDGQQLTWDEECELEYCQNGPDWHGD